MLIKCTNCQKDFIKKSKIHQYCSKICQKKAEHKRYRKYNGDPLYLPKNTIGAISEFVVSCDLLKKGYEVFRSLSPSASCDIAILKNNKLLRIEVTTASFSCSGKIMHASKKKDKGKFDILAVYNKVNEEILYIPDCF